MKRPDESRKLENAPIGSSGCQERRKPRPAIGWAPRPNPAGPQSAPKHRVAAARKRDHKKSAEDT